MQKLKKLITKKNISILLFFVVLLIISEFAMFWVIIPFLASVLLFMLITLVKDKSYIFYPILIIASILLAFAVGELFLTIQQALA